MAPALLSLVEGYFDGAMYDSWPSDFGDRCSESARTRIADLRPDNSSRGLMGRIMTSAQNRIRK